jgi:signal peptidase I
MLAEKRRGDMTDEPAPSARRTFSGAPNDAPTTTAGTSRDGRGAQDERTGPQDRASRGRSAGRFLRDVLLILLAAIVISFLIKTFLIRSFYIPSASMESTLMVNDRIIVNELEPALMPIHHGDIVVFRDPGGWLPPSSAVQETGVAGVIDGALSVVGLTAPDSNNHLIKRVIGLPGDKVACCNAFGQMTVNGVPLSEPYLMLPPGVTKVSRDAFSVTVPANSLWVMGDNRYDSADSRYNRDKPGNGFVPFSDVVGRAILISWPIDRWTILDNYPLTFAGVESGDGSGKNNSNVTSTPGPAATTSGG